MLPAIRGVSQSTLPGTIYRPYMYRKLGYSLNLQRMYPEEKYPDRKPRHVVNVTHPELYWKWKCLKQRYTFWRNFMLYVLYGLFYCRTCPTILRNLHHQFALKVFFKKPHLSYWALQTYHLTKETSTIERCCRICENGDNFDFISGFLFTTSLISIMMEDLGVSWVRDQVFGLDGITESRTYCWYFLLLYSYLFLITDRNIRSKITKQKKPHNIKFHGFNV